MPDTPPYPTGRRALRCFAYAPRHAARTRGCRHLGMVRYPSVKGGGRWRDASFSDLGSGFNIALRDLDIRGAGNLLGAEQSGFINDIGFETYHKILDEAILELKETEFKDIFLRK